MKILHTKQLKTASLKKVNEMAQCMKELATNPYNLSLTPGTTHTFTGGHLLMPYALVYCLKNRSAHKAENNHQLVYNSFLHRVQSSK